jgi:hypothetical protein
LQLTGQHSLLHARHFFQKRLCGHRDMSQMLNRKHPAMERGFGFVQMNPASGYRAALMCGRISTGIGSRSQ